MPSDQEHTVKASNRIKISLIIALTTCSCFMAGCNRNRTTVTTGNAASDTAAAAPASGASVPTAASFPATAASDTPSGASQ
ncbi:hypothetical protein BSFA1_77570 (plasmid) [Burkholderia sp. SFA1]|nr:hypothetical protein BG58_29260 [Caballeronia jiangsuensis]BBQ02629.1 hypothetical protein BSFA1_77570 [Burkholderia sp. SFA1]